MLKSYSIKVTKITLWILGITAISCIIIAGAFELFVLQNIDSYRDNIAQFASAELQQKVSIKHIHAKWDGINPKLILSDVMILDENNHPVLTLKNTSILLSWLSIPLFEPHIAKIIFYQASVTVKRTNTGEIFIAGIPLKTKREPIFLNWVLRQSNILFHQANIEWLDEFRIAPPLKYTIDFALERPVWNGLLKQHYFYLKARSLVATTKPIVLSGQFYGDDVRKFAAWTGEAQANLEDTRFIDFNPWLDIPTDFVDLHGDIKMDISLSAQFFSATGEISLDKLNFIHDSRTFSLNGNFDIKNNRKFTHDYSVSLNKFSLTDDQGLNVRNLKARYTNNAQQEHAISINLDHIDTALLTTHPLPFGLTIPEIYKQLNVNARLNEVVLNWHNKSRYEFSARFENLGSLAYQVTPQFELPEFSNLSGNISLDQDSGLLTLETTKTQIYYKDLFRWPIRADKLTGNIKWSTLNDKLYVNVDELKLNNDHLDILLNGKYTKENEEHIFDMVAKISGNAKYALFYYPTTLNAATLHWLDTSILSGEVKNGEILLRGNLKDFPFKNKNTGVFRASAEVNNVLMEYGSNWPVIDKLNARLLVEGSRLSVFSTNGYIYGNKINKAVTIIPNLAIPEPMLEITGELKSPATELLKFVKHSPVHEVTQGLVDNLSASGSGLLNIKVNIPMQHLDRSKYQGTYRMNELRLTESNIPNVAHLNGVLNFSDKGIFARNLNAVAWNTPVKFNVDSKSNMLNLQLSGVTTDDVLSNTLGKYSKYITGNATWNANIWLNKSKFSMNVQSNLQGAQIKLPYPLEKKQQDILLLKINKTTDNNTNTLAISLGNRLYARALGNSPDNPLAFERGTIYLGNAHTPNTASQPYKGFAIYGNLDSVDGDAWRNILFDTDANISFIPSKLDISINKLDIFGRSLHNLKLWNTPTINGIGVGIKSTEMNGDIEFLHQNQNRIIARFSTLSVPERNSNPIDTTDNARTTPYPDFEISADNFVWEDKKLGALRFNAYHQDKDLIIKELKLTNPDSLLVADGKFSQKQPYTQINVKCSFNDMDAMLSKFNYANLMQGGKGEIKGKIGFAGELAQFSVRALEGELQFEVRKGTVLKVQPGVGRLFGVLSLQNLPRRLSLDFRDLFNNGFAFDKISATIKIANGVMRSENFVMLGPAAEVNMRGEINLQKETQNLHVKVTPQISDSISLASLAGGPLVGALAFLAQKVLKDPFNKIASTRYEIIGTWDNPQEKKAAEVSPINPINH